MKNITIRLKQGLLESSNKFTNASDTESESNYDRCINEQEQPCTSAQYQDSQLEQSLILQSHIDQGRNLQKRVMAETQKSATFKNQVRKASQGARISKQAEVKMQKEIERARVDLKQSQRILKQQCKNMRSGLDIKPNVLRKNGVISAQCSTSHLKKFKQQTNNETARPISTTHRHRQTPDFLKQSQQVVLTQSTARQGQSQSKVQKIRKMIGSTEKRIDSRKIPSKAVVNKNQQERSTFSQQLQISKKMLLQRLQILEDMEQEHMPSDGGFLQNLDNQIRNAKSRLESQGTKSGKGADKRVSRSRNSRVSKSHDSAKSPSSFQERRKYSFKQKAAQSQTQTSKSKTGRKAYERPNTEAESYHIKSQRYSDHEGPMQPIYEAPSRYRSRNTRKSCEVTDAHSRASRRSCCESVGPRDRNIEKLLKKENKDIQKQYMKCKTELYEINFKNKALKQKLEKTKNESKLHSEKLNDSYKRQRDLLKSNQRRQNEILSLRNAQLQQDKAFEQIKSMLTLAQNHQNTAANQQSNFLVNQALQISFNMTMKSPAPAQNVQNDASEPSLHPHGQEDVDDSSYGPYPNDSSSDLQLQNNMIHIENNDHQQSSSWFEGTALSSQMEDASNSVDAKQYGQGLTKVNQQMIQYYDSSIEQPAPRMTSSQISSYVGCGPQDFYPALPKGVAPGAQGESCYEEDEESHLEDDRASQVRNMQDRHLVDCQIEGEYGGESQDYQSNEGMEMEEGSEMAENMNVAAGDHMIEIIPAQDGCSTTGEQDHIDLDYTAPQEVESAASYGELIESNEYANEEEMVVENVKDCDLDIQKFKGNNLNQGRQPQCSYVPTGSFNSEQPYSYSKSKDGNAQSERINGEQETRNNLACLQSKQLPSIKTRLAEIPLYQGQGLMDNIDSNSTSKQIPNPIQTPASVLSADQQQLLQKSKNLQINTDANSTLTMQNIQQNAEPYSQQTSTTNSKQSNIYNHHLRQLQQQLQDLEKASNSRGGPIGNQHQQANMMKYIQQIGTNNQFNNQAFSKQELNNTMDMVNGSQSTDQNGHKQMEQMLTLKNMLSNQYLQQSCRSTYGLENNVGQMGPASSHGTQDVGGFASTQGAKVSNECLQGQDYAHNKKEFNGTAGKNRTGTMRDTAEAIILNQVQHDFNQLQNEQQSTNQSRLQEDEKDKASKKSHHNYDFRKLCKNNDTKANAQNAMLMHDRYLAPTSKMASQASLEEASNKSKKDSSQEDFGNDVEDSFESGRSRSQSERDSDENKVHRQNQGNQRDKMKLRTEHISTKKNYQDIQENMRHLLRDCADQGQHPQLLSDQYRDKGHDQGYNDLITGIGDAYGQNDQANFKNKKNSQITDYHFYLKCAHHFESSLQSASQGTQADQKIQILSNLNQNSEFDNLVSPQADNMDANYNLFNKNNASSEGGRTRPNNGERQETEASADRSVNQRSIHIETNESSLDPKIVQQQKNDMTQSPNRVGSSLVPPEMVSADLVHNQTQRKQRQKPQEIQSGVRLDKIIENSQRGVTKYDRYERPYSVLEQRGQNGQKLENFNQNYGPSQNSKEKDGSINATTASKQTRKKHFSQLSHISKVSQSQISSSGLSKMSKSPKIPKESKMIKSNDDQNSSMNQHKISDSNGYKPAASVFSVGCPTPNESQLVNMASGHSCKNLPSPLSQNRQGLPKDCRPFQSQKVAEFRPERFQEIQNMYRGVIQTEGPNQPGQSAASKEYADSHIDTLRRNLKDLQDLQSNQLHHPNASKPPSSHLKSQSSSSKLAPNTENDSQITTSQNTHPNRPNMFDNITNTLTTITSNTNTLYTNNPQPCSSRPHATGPSQPAGAGASQQCSSSRTYHLMTEINSLDKEIYQLQNSMGEAIVSQTSRAHAEYL